MEAAKEGVTEAEHRQSLSVEHGCGAGKEYIEEAMGYGRAAPADPDAESLSIKIGQHMQALTQDAVEHLLSVKLRMLASLEAAVEHEQQVGISTVATKQAEIDLLRSEVQDNHKQLARAERCMERLSDGFAQKSQAVQDTKSLVVAWFMWRQHIIRKRKLARQWRRAEQYYTQTWLLGRAWNRWAGRARAHYKQLAAQHAEQQRQIEVSTLNATHKQQATGLKADIMALQQQLQHEAEARNRMEEELKRAFMRGVTAINLEAVQIMRRGAPPSGANPFPVTLPLNASTAAAGLVAAVEQRHHQERQLQQEQQATESYIVTPVPAVNGVRQPLAVAAGNVVVQGTAASPRAADAEVSMNRGAGSPSSRLVHAVHPVMGSNGGVAPPGTAGGTEQVKMLEADCASSAPLASGVQTMGRSLPKVTVERGPAGIAGFAQMNRLNGSAGRLAGPATQHNVGKVAGAAARGLSIGHTHGRLQ